MHDLIQGETDFETFVLQHTFDGHLGARRLQFRMKNDAKGAVPNHLALSVAKLLDLASAAIVDLLANKVWQRGC